MGANDKVAAAFHGVSRGVVELSEQMNDVLEAVDQSPAPISALEITEIVEVKHATIRLYLRRLESHGLVYRVSHGLYASTK